MIALKNNYYSKYIIFSYLTIFVHIITGFILFPLILKFEGIEGLALFGVLFSLKSFFDISISSTTSSIIKNLIKYKYLRSTFFSFSLVLNCFLALIGFLFFYLYGSFLKNEYITAILFFCLFILFNLTINTFYEYMIATSKQHIVVFFRFLLQFILFILLMGFYIIELISLKNIFLSYFISSFLLLIIVYIFFKKNYSIKFCLKKVNKKLILKVLEDSKSFFYYNIGIVLLFSLDVIIIDFLFGSEKAALYLLIFKIPNTIIMLGHKLSEPLRIVFKEQVDKKTKFIEKNFYNYEKKIVLFSFLLSLVFYFFGEYLMYFWLGASIKIPAIDNMFILLSILIFLSIMQEFYISLVYYDKRIVKSSIYTLILVFFKVIFIYLFFEYFDILTPFIAWTIMLIIFMIFYRKNCLSMIGVKNGF